jgi:hypothetical protein
MTPYYDYNFGDVAISGIVLVAMLVALLAGTVETRNAISGEGGLK